MILPVRCFTCGKVIGNMGPQFQELTDAGMDFPNIMISLGLKRICCKRMLQTHVNCADKMAEYDTLPENVKRTSSIDNNRIYKAI